MVALETDKDHILHRIGDEDYTEMRQATVRPEDADSYEEVAVADVPDTEAEGRYKASVSALVHERYDLDDEVALLANRDDGDENHAAEYAAYQAYRAECKARAAAELATPAPETL